MMIPIAIGSVSSWRQWNWRTTGTIGIPNDSITLSGDCEGIIATEWIHCRFHYYVIILMDPMAIDDDRHGRQWNVAIGANENSILPFVSLGIQMLYES